MSGITKRVLDIGHDTCIMGYSGRDYVKSYVFDASTLSFGGVDEVQTVTVNGGPAGGTFTLSRGIYTTDPIAFNAAASAVQTALQALPNIGSGGATVAGSGGGPYTVTYAAGLGKQKQKLLTADGSALTGGTSPSVAVTEVTPGDALDFGRLVLPTGLILTKTADGKKVREYTGADDIDEVQTLTITGTPTGGTFKLRFDGEETAGIAFNAAASAVQSALEALVNVEVGDVVCTGGALPGTPVVITFGGLLSGQSVPEIQFSTNALTGGTNPTGTIAQTTQGGAQEIEAIFDGFIEFMTNTPTGSKEVPGYNHNVVFDKTKIRNFSTHEGALRAWAAKRDCVFEAPTA